MAQTGGVEIDELKQVIDVCNYEKAITPVWGRNEARMKELKRKYDPNNVFEGNIPQG
jgi:hypothetical protein